MAPRGNVKKPKASEVELQPDAWQRFERAVGAVAKSKPQHKTKTTQVKKKSKPKAGGKRALSR
jgi:hypothetical protein